jgi:hypothetical protein
MKFNPYTKKAAGTVVDRKSGNEFNPLNVGVTKRSGTLQRSASEKMFNNQGEMNASDTKEVLTKIKHLLDGQSSGMYDVEHRTASYAGEGVGAQEQEAILREAFSDPSSEGFKQVGQGLLNPIKEVIDYEGLARKVFAPRTVKAGEVVRYDKDAFVRAWVIAEDGQTPQSVVEGRYVYPPEFEVTAYPSIEIKDKYRAQYDILARVQDRARMAIEYQEDLALMNLLQAGAPQVNTTTLFATLNLAALESIRYQIERHRLICDKFLIHRQELSDLINNLNNLQVDPVTRRELVMAGFIGTILNAMIITTAGTNTYEILNPGEVVAVTTPEYLGGMPIRVELFSEPVNEFMEGRPRQGWFWYELISQVLINPAGVALGQLTV